jgi:hypothetical protein
LVNVIEIEHLKKRVKLMEKERRMVGRDGKRFTKHKRRTLMKKTQADTNEMCNYKKKS